MTYFDDSKVYLNESWGGIVGNGGLLFPLTPCCQASGTGTGTRTGHICFGCGQPVLAVFRRAVRVTDHFATRDLAAILAAMEGVSVVQRHLDLAGGIVGREASRQRHPSRSGRAA
jgi:hypothetical protein